MNNKIKFGTDGWRAIIAEEYNFENLSRVTIGTLKWLKKRNNNPSVVIGYDCRFGGEIFSDLCAKILSSSGVNVIQSTTFAATPVVSYAVKHFNCDLGIVITASHNPAEYSGFKLKGSYGGPLTQKEILEVEELIPDKSNLNYEKLNSENIKYQDLDLIYLNNIEKEFDFELMSKKDLKIAYNGMFGAGQGIMKKLSKYFSKHSLYHNCCFNPSFNNINPEPIFKNLQDFSNIIQNDISFAFANDGDADRIGIMNEKGHFVDSHHVMLLLIHYLVSHKKITGDVVTSFSCSNKIKKLCDHHGLNHQVTKIGFKYIADIILKNDVLIGGEESGGISVKGHIPERDGIWTAMILIEYIAKSGKSINELIEEIYDITGPFCFKRNDLKISTKEKNQIIKMCENDSFSHFQDLKVIKVEKLDGFKFIFNEDEWVMIRPSGTEPLLRIYAEGSSEERAESILSKTIKTISN